MKPNQRVVRHHEGMAESVWLTVLLVATLAVIVWTAAKCFDRPNVGELNHAEGEVAP